MESGSAFGRYSVDGLDGLARAVAGLDVAADRGRRVEVVARDGDGAADLPRVDQRAQQNHLPELVADLEQVEVFDLAAIAAVGLDRDLPVTAEIVEAVDVERAHQNVQRLVHVVQRHAQRGDLVAVDVEVELRRLGAELGGHPAQAGDLPQFLDQAVGLLLQGDQAEVAAVLDDELEAAGDAEARDRRRPEHRELGLRHVLGAGLARSWFMIAVSRSSGFLPLVEGVQHDEHRGEIRAVGLQQKRTAREGHRVGDAGRPAGDLLDLGDDRFGALQRRRVGQLDVHDQPALVLLRNEAGRRLLEVHVGQRQSDRRRPPTRPG